MTTQQLTITGTTIRQDSEGRYCLNDLHRAAGGEGKYQPAFWLRNAKTKELIGAMDNSANLQIIPIAAVEGRHGGTYVSKPLVYAYAMWISPQFHLQVIEVFDQYATKGIAMRPEVKELMTEMCRSSDLRNEGNQALMVYQGGSGTQGTIPGIPGIQAKQGLGTFVYKPLVESLDRRLKNKQVPNMALDNLVVQHGGDAPGVYATRLIVYAYAAWISPDFHAQVYEVFDQYATKGIAMRPEVATEAVESPESFLARAVLVACKRPVLHFLIEVVPTPRPPSENRL